ncbi:radical SAM (seleno)protein TrsS [Dethiosulfatarculus sandiegensis]|uniref:Radical SAM protein n=1 Tax=Dethiosulfatarculus sandiegensis TaxID=1429043 RepID=A0A0D2HQ35_9BACT|nr:radical SAM (seleno)protein TrsS [Dethiosulfatarculus sandiegensis]KIX12583.1 radical SAM protein [Dethiosulfatarculus sandiegensis]
MPNNKITAGGILSQTQSLCPVCFRLLKAQRVLKGNEIFLEKQCPEHGVFSTVIWRGEPEFTSWVRPKIPSYPQNPATDYNRGCPFDCGLCPEHRQHTCTALMEITQNCDLGCPVCFASSDKKSLPDPELKEIMGWCRAVMQASGPRNIQLSGGEPTMRKDLSAIIEMVRNQGFSFVQLNTNGIKLGQRPGYAQELRQAGLASVFLQFDGCSDKIQRKIRGADLLRIKLKAIENSVQAGLGVVLVPTLIPGINTNDLGKIMELALDLAPGIRGVHFQPVSYFGRFPHDPSDRDRLTLPEIMQGLYEQTKGLLKITDFHPPGCENALCSFSAAYVKTGSQSLTRLGGETGQCNCSQSEPEVAALGAQRSVDLVAERWSAPAQGACGCSQVQNYLSFDDFLGMARTNTFTVSAMAFQDAWNLDLERVKDCCIHVVSPDKRLIPFCLYNLTDIRGKTLYRKV